MVGNLDATVVHYPSPILLHCTIVHYESARGIPHIPFIPFELVDQIRWFIIKALFDATVQTLLKNLRWAGGRFTRNVQMN